MWSKNLLNRPVITKYLVKVKKYIHRTYIFYCISIMATMISCRCYLSQKTCCGYVDISILILWHYYFLAMWTNVSTTCSFVRLGWFIGFHPYLNLNRLMNKLLTPVWMEKEEYWLQALPTSHKRQMEVHKGRKKGRMISKERCNSRSRMIYKQKKDWMLSQFNYRKVLIKNKVKKHTERERRLEERMAQSMEANVNCGDCGKREWKRGEVSNTEENERKRKRRMKQWSHRGKVHIG